MGFERGQSGNPRGRPKGSYGGRIQALAALDKILAKSKNKKLLAQALEKEFRADPARFFKGVIMPLLPKESKVEVDRAGIVEWKTLVEAFPRSGPPGPGVRGQGSGNRKSLAEAQGAQREI